MLDVSFTSDARLDLQTAVQWYDDQRPGLGERFIISVNRFVTIIGAFPESYPPARPGVHKAKLTDFPYSLHYRILPDQILVIACLHHSRDIDSIIEHRT